MKVLAGPTEKYSSPGPRRFTRCGFLGGAVGLGGAAGAGTLPGAVPPLFTGTGGGGVVPGPTPPLLPSPRAAAGAARAKANASRTAASRLGTATASPTADRRLPGATKLSVR